MRRELGCNADNCLRVLGTILTHAYENPSRRSLRSTVSDRHEASGAAAKCLNQNICGGKAERFHVHTQRAFVESEAGFYKGYVS